MVKLRTCTIMTGHPLKVPLAKGVNITKSKRASSIIRSGVEKLLSQLKIIYSFTVQVRAIKP